MILYKILRFIVNLFCVCVALLTIFLIPFSFGSPLLLLECFLLISVVLYGWFANRFYINVVINKQKMTRKQKDWLQVNAIVAFIFTVISIASAATVIANP